MELLYVPWRSKYSKKNNKKELKKASVCPFCKIFAINSTLDNKEALILKRFDHCAVVLNLYPYNKGHILVIPYKHTANLCNLSLAEQAEVMHVISLSSATLEKVFNADGLNIGMNKGAASGGSVPDHLHLHIIPRFIGDTNFLAAIGEVRQMSFDIQEIYNQLISYFENLKF